jgi:hypothetical protein
MSPYYICSKAINSGGFMTWHCIYKEIDEISFMGMKLIQLVFNVV